MLETWMYDFRRQLLFSISFLSRSTRAQSTLLQSLYDGFDYKRKIWWWSKKKKLELQKKEENEEDEEKEHLLRHIKLCRNLSTAILRFSYFSCRFNETLFWPVEKKLFRYFWINSMEIILMIIIFPVVFSLLSFHFHHSIIQAIVIKINQNVVRNEKKNNNKKNGKFAHKWEWIQKSTTITILNAMECDLFMMMMMKTIIHFVHSLNSIILITMLIVSTFNRLELIFFRNLTFLLLWLLLLLPK